MAHRSRYPGIRMGALLLTLLLMLSACGGEAATSIGGTLSNSSPSASAIPANVAPSPTSTTPPTVAPSPTATLPPTVAPATATATSIASTMPSATPVAATATRTAPSTSARPSASAATSPAPSAAASGPVAVQVENASAIRLSSRFDAIGELVNAGTSDVRLGKISVTVLDEAGKVVASGNSSATGLDILPVGERTVFQVALSPRIDRWKDVQVQVESTAATAAMRAAYVEGLTVQKLTPPVKPTGISSGAVMTGEFLNGGSVRSNNPVITVAGYSADGKLTHYGRVAGIINWLVPGATTPFAVEFYVGPETVPEKYEYWIYASRSTAAVTPVALEATIAGKDDGSRLSYFGTVRNPSATDVGLLQVSVTLYGGGGNVVGASQSIIRGVDLLAPGAETIWASYMSPLTGEVQEAKVQIYANEPSASDRERLYPDLTASEVTFAPAGSTQRPRQTASGQVTNGGTGTAYLLTVVIAVYDGGGKLILVDSTSVTPGELGPGVSGKFSISLEGLAAAPPKYEIIIRASRKT